MNMRTKRRIDSTITDLHLTCIFQKNRDILR